MVHERESDFFIYEPFFIGQNNLLFLKNKACPNFLLRKYTLE